MIRSIYSGVSGLNAHQTKLDVIGDNIANVNTVAFKKSTVNFEASLSSTVKGSVAPQSGYGGRNAIQIGSGTQISSINVNFEEGNMQYTGRDNDLRISGDGFFMVSDNSNTYYTRAGDFQLDGDGTFVSSEGLKVQGWSAGKKSDGTTEIKAGTPLGDLNIKLGEILPAKATSVVTYSGNLNQRAGLENLVLEVDADGSGPDDRKIKIEIEFNYNSKTEVWEWKAKGPAADGITGNGSFKLESGEISQVYKGSEIRNGAGTVLIREPIPGPITFTAVSDATISKTAPFVSNEYITTNNVYDSLGDKHSLSMKYTKIDQNIWTWGATVESGLDVNNAKGIIVFDAFGQMAGNYRQAEVEYPIDPVTGLATDDLTLATLGEYTDEEGVVVGNSSVPTSADLGVAWDTTVAANYFILNEDGTTGGSATSPYQLDKNGIIKYRGLTDLANPTVIPTTDAAGNTIDAITLSSAWERGAIVNKVFTGNMMFDPAEKGGAIPPDEGAQPVKILGDFSNTTQFTDSTSVVFDEQNGYKMGTLETYRIQENGDIVGFYSNDFKQVVGRIALTTFNNASGLEKVGGSKYIKTANSGEPILLEAGTAGAGRINANSLEMSNVDLSQEFTDMIIAQRGFQANSKTITTADEILQELIGLKR